MAIIWPGPFASAYILCIWCLCVSLFLSLFFFFFFFFIYFGQIKLLKVKGVNESF